VAWTDVLKSTARQLQMAEAGAKASYTEAAKHAVL
jgi:hypothetical protein